MKRYFFAVGLYAVLCAPALAAEPSAFADFAGFGHIVKPDITYATASNVALKLDLYLPRNANKPVPALIYFHGGGWVEGRKENAVLMLMPYIAMGWAVVNVEYRLGKTAAAPAAVEDSRCAVRWVQRMAGEYGIDAGALVVAGDSAGGHLAMLAAMLPAGSPYDRACPTSDAARWGSATEPPVKIAAVVNWFGVADADALLDGPDARHFAIEWFGAGSGADLQRHDLARAISPLRQVRAGLPPLISIHGSADPVVPYGQSVALHAALTRAGVPNELVTIAGANHGGFNREQVRRANDAIRAFLKLRGLPD